MCELLGISSRRAQRANGILRQFYARADRQPHGWGLAQFPDGGSPHVEKEPVKATESVYLRNRLAAPVEGRTVLAHIRYATVGLVEYANCHPFVAADDARRVWTFIHNGTIFGFPPLEEFTSRQQGTTDSERVLLYFVSRMNAEIARLRRPLDETERFDVLSRTVAPLAEGNKLNFLLFDGDVLYAHSNFRNTLHFRRDGERIVLSTQPLGGDGWELLPFMRLMAVKDGAFVREGAVHGHEYIFDPGDYKFIYMDFATL